MLQNIKIVLPLHCVFHGIRFKVGRLEVERLPSFFKQSNFLHHFFINADCFSPFLLNQHTKEKKGIASHLSSIHNS